MYPMVSSKIHSAGQILRISLLFGYVSLEHRMFLMCVLPRSECEGTPSMLVKSHVRRPLNSLESCRALQLAEFEASSAFVHFRALALPCRLLVSFCNVTCVVSVTKSAPDDGFHEHGFLVADIPVSAQRQILAQFQLRRLSFRASSTGASRPEDSRDSYFFLSYQRRDYRQVFTRRGVESCAERCEQGVLAPS